VHVNQEDEVIDESTNEVIEDKQDEIKKIFKYYTLLLLQAFHRNKNLFTEGQQKKYGRLDDIVTRYRKLKMEIPYIGYKIKYDDNRKPVDVEKINEEGIKREKLPSYDMKNDIKSRYSELVGLLYEFFQDNKDYIKKDIKKNG
jgi:hypothetical protein